MSVNMVRGSGGLLRATVPGVVRELAPAPVYLHPCRPPKSFYFRVFNQSHPHLLAHSAQTFTARRLGATLRLGQVRNGLDLGGHLREDLRDGCET